MAQRRARPKLLRAAARHHSGEKGRIKGVPVCARESLCVCVCVCVCPTWREWRGAGQWPGFPHVEVWSLLAAETDLEAGGTQWALASRQAVQQRRATQAAMRACTGSLFHALCCAKHSV